MSRVASQVIRQVVTKVWRLWPTFAAAAVIGVVCAAVPARSPGALVEISIVDDASGEVTPAMVCITDLRNGSVRLPPDGREMERPSLVPEFTAGLRLQGGEHWIGPPRKTKGRGDNKDRSYVYEDLPSLPYWDEPAMYMTSGRLTIRLPKGRYRLAVARGMEYVPVVQEIATGGQAATARTVRLKRWTDLAARGWYSGDVHVHHPTLEPAHREFLLAYARAEDVHVVNVLQQEHHRAAGHSPQAGFGAKFRSVQGNHWLISGQEAPSGRFGHVIGLAANRLVHDPATFDLYDVAFRRLHEAGGLVGYAHFSWRGCDLPRGFPWSFTTGEIDFVELLQFMKVNTLDYYDYLNLGLKLTAAAGSDVPWGSTIGEVRTYAYTGQPFDPDRWFEALKRGRTFVSNGPAIELTVDGQMPGAEIAKAAGSTARVLARLQSHERIGLPCTLRVVDNDGVVSEATSMAGRDRVAVETELKVGASRWLVAAAACKNGAVAHTSPVYLVVDGQPFWSPKRGPAVIDKQLAAIQPIEQEYEGTTDTVGRAVLERLRKATAFYRRTRDALTAPISEAAPSSAPAASAPLALRTYTFKVVDGVGLQVDVYRSEAPGPVPVLVWIHGGALIMGSRASVPRRLLDLCKVAGCAVVSIDYRLAPQVKLAQIIDDVRDAFAWLGGKGAAEARLDPRRIVVAGGSAGGYLTLMSGVVAKPRPLALVAYWGYGDVDGEWYTQPSTYYRTHEPLYARDQVLSALGSSVVTSSSDRTHTEARQRYYHYLRQNGLWTREVVGPRSDRHNPIRNVTAAFPPTLLVHGTEDEDVPYDRSVLMAKELERNKVAHELITVPGGRHGLAGASPGIVADAHARALAFIRAHLNN